MWERWIDMMPGGIQQGVKGVAQAYTVSLLVVTVRVTCGLAVKTTDL